MGNCCSCVCKNRNVFLDESVGYDWAYDFEFTEFEEEEDETFMRDEALDKYTVTRFCGHSGIGSSPTQHPSIL